VFRQLNINANGAYKAPKDELKTYITYVTGYVHYIFQNTAAVLVGTYT
jgi:hypothetical protein